MIENKNHTNQSVTKEIAANPCTDPSTDTCADPYAAPYADIEIHVITRNAEFDALKDNWNKLHAQSNSSGLFNTWHWNWLWWQHYAQLGSLHIIAAYTKGRLIGLAPLYQCNTTSLKLINANTFRLIGSGADTSPDDLGFICDQQLESIATDAMCDAMFKYAGCARIEFRDLRDDKQLQSSLMHHAKSSGWSAPLKAHKQRLVDTLPESINAFEKNLSRNARKQRKRRRTKLYQASKNVSFDFCSNYDDIETAFQELTRLHNLRRSGKGNSDSFQTENYRQFHLALMKKALDKQELKLLTLSIDDKTVGVEYAFLCNGTLSFFQTGFDPAFEHLSPGHVLMMHTIDQAIQEGATHIDLLKGNYPYKKTYAKHIRESVDMEFWSSDVMYWLKHLLRKLKSSQAR